MPRQFSYFNHVALPPSEVARINRELRKVQDAVAGTGVRGSSGRNVIRYVLGRIGATSRKALRRTTPTGRRPIWPAGRIPLKRLVKGGLAKGRAGRVLYRAGYIRAKTGTYIGRDGRPKPINRFQQALAVEHGTKAGSRAQKHIAGALETAIGPGGKRYRELFNREFDKRIAFLFAKANARRSRLGR